MRSAWDLRRPPESGLSLGDIAAKELSTALLTTLQDPAIRAELGSAAGTLVGSPEFRAGIRPTLAEAAVWVGIGVFGGYTLYEVLIRRR